MLLQSLSSFWAILSAVQWQTHAIIINKCKTCHSKKFFFWFQMNCIVVLHVTTKFEFIRNNIERSTAKIHGDHHITQQVQKMSFQKKNFFFVPNRLYSCITCYYKVWVHSEQYWALYSQNTWWSSHHSTSAKNVIPKKKFFFRSKSFV